MQDGEFRLFAVLVTFNRKVILQSTLDRIENQSRQLDGLVIIDNAADPEVEDLVAEYPGTTSLSYVAALENLGPAGGFAFGMKKLLETVDDDDWIFMLDDDDPPFFDDAFENAGRFAGAMTERDSRVGGVGISGGRFDIRKARVIRIGDDQIHGPVPVDHITGGGMPAYKVAAIKQAGVFDADLFFGFEELEYGLRLVENGYTIYADGEQWRFRKEAKRASGLLPLEDVSAAKASRTNIRVAPPSWRRYYSMRNLIYILRNHGASGAAVRVSLERGLGKALLNLFTSPRIAMENLEMNWAAVTDGWAGRMGRTIEPGAESVEQDG